MILQNQFQIITLPQENYYVSVVPMHFPVLALFLVNVGAFVVCYLALVLPSYIVTKITPVKAIKFDLFYLPLIKKNKPLNSFN